MATATSMDRAWQAAAARAQILSSEKQTTIDGAEIMTLTHAAGPSVLLGGPPSPLQRSTTPDDADLPDRPAFPLPGGGDDAAATGTATEPAPDDTSMISGARAEEGHAHTENGGASDGGGGGAPAAGASISYEDLHFDFVHAAQTGDADQLRLVLELKIDVNVQDDDGYPALTLAACYGHVEAVEVLLEAPDVDFDTMANDGCTALQVAAQDGFAEVVELLVRARADLDLAHKGAAGPLFLAAQEGHVGIVGFLAEARADVNRTRQAYSPLFIAAQEGHTEVLRVLVDFQADLNLQAQNGSTPLYIACQKGRIEAVECLVTSGADVNLSKADSSSPLLISLLNGYKGITGLLVDAGADVNLSFSDGSTPLMAAAYGGDIQTITRLVSAGADLHAENEAGDSAPSIFRNKFGGDLEAMLKRRALVYSPVVRENMKLAIEANLEKRAATLGGGAAGHASPQHQQPQRPHQHDGPLDTRLTVADAALRLTNSAGDVVIKPQPKKVCVIS